ncbi:prolyl 3-hydroxylase OGFOD1 isoform X2 [Adelges cooleyi]|uniref:prolyl 3-hydroxylase OGFOD1 isoform X2 n=1 Tax=Adelges cooleyi TaxID=133065 RepID=UPI00217FE814|nr:prolyl 3-hydroxylase OGFOD1 isoform X2 [Adelges cooleyi]
MNNNTKNANSFDGPFNFKGVTKLDAPYDIYKLDCKNIISNSDAFKLRSALLTMKFKKKSCDLYSFGQSPDFYRISNKDKPDEVQQFLLVLAEMKKKIATFLEKTFNKTTSVSCSMYNHGDYLLCHDDRVDDRSVAFIYYLNYDWLNEWGGTLDVYSIDENYNAKEIVNSINPEFNTMIFFPVGQHTYHQVAENVSNFSRISINGWFHCDSLSWKPYDQQVELPTPIFLPITVSKTKTYASEFIETIFEDPDYREIVRESFVGDGFIMLEGFFKQEMVDIFSNEIFSNDLKWQVNGPLNKRNYKYVDLNDLPDKVLFVVNLMKTDFMFEFLKECTGINLSGVSVEVQRWHGGHYMVSGGNDGVDHLNVLSVYLFFSQCFGQMSDNIKDDLHYVFEERHTLQPVNRNLRANLKTTLFSWSRETPTWSPM